MGTHEWVKQVSESEFDAEVLGAPGKVLVEVGATWCGPCKLLRPIVQKIAEDHRGSLRVAEMDVDDSPGIMIRYGVRSAPTLLVFENGRKVAQHVGLTTRERILELVGLG
jgi:thioredoxin 1